MPLTSRDHEEIERASFKEPRFTSFFVSVIRVIAKVPLVNKYVSESRGGLMGKICNCWKKEDYEQATNIAIHALEKYRDRKSKLLPFMDHHFWWQFMQVGVDSAGMIENNELREKLIEYAKAGIEPFEGYDVARSFMEFSRWKYSNKEYDEAVVFAQISSKADRTWSEPDFILGWYSLVLDKEDAEEHLGRAIEKDRRILFRIANNDVCKQYPHIIKHLKAKYSNQPFGSDSNV